MVTPSEFVASLKFIHPKDLFRRLKDEGWPRGGFLLEIHNEIRPVDLFCYLGARFGAPNGVQNFLRADDSDNLVHWDWTLAHENGLVLIQGLNFRTEIRIHGESGLDADAKAELIAAIKADFAPHGAGMSQVRGSLESWIEFVNPYQRIRRSVERLLSELSALKLIPDQERIDTFWASPDLADIAEAWKATAERYSKGFGLCFGVRAMLPVMGEAFVNLVLYMLLRPEIRQDERLRENTIRQPIDVRIKSLSINCVGFVRQPDYASEPCRAYHRLVNDRNDLLHGNVVVDKLKFNQVYFLGKVPVFREYRSPWERSLEVELNAVGLKQLSDELSIVEQLIEYLLSCLASEVREQVEMVARAYELGLNQATQGLGILFPPWLVDFRGVRSEEDRTEEGQS